MVSAMSLSLSFPQNGQAVMRTKARPSHIMWSPWPGARETARGPGPLTQGAGLPARLQLLGGGCPASHTRLGWGLFPRKSQDLAKGTPPPRSHHPRSLELEPPRVLRLVCLGPWDLLGRGGPLAGGD